MRVLVLQGCLGCLVLEVLLLLRHPSSQVLRHPSSQVLPGQGTLGTPAVPTPASGGGASSAPKAGTPRQTGIAGFFHNPHPTPQQRRAKEKRDEKRRQEVAAAVAHPTTPARAAHIDKTRVVRNNAQERQRQKRKVEEEEEEDEEGRERKVAGEKTKRCRRRGPKGNGVSSNERCKSVRVLDRIKQFPDQTLFEQNGKLMCEACGRKPLTKYKNTISNHCRGRQHIAAVTKLQSSKKKHQTTIQMFRDFSAAAGGSYASTLSPREVMAQILFTKGCLSAGVPLYALNNPAMKEALLHSGVKLPSSSHLSNHIPVIINEEVRTILEELGEGNYTVCFDGTPYRCECFGVGIRFIGKDGKICQRLLGLSMLAKSMDFRAIFGEVHNILFNKFKLESKRCRGFMLDGCAANMKALLALTTHCGRAVGMRCMSHLLNNAGGQIESNQIDKFAGALQTILSHSANASEQWRSATHTAPPKVPSHRWASSFERSDLLVTNWQQMKTFIDVFSRSDETKSAKARFCREELAKTGKDGYHQEIWLQLEFALAVDLGVNLTRGTYLLEGDDMLLPVAYEAILRVRSGLALTRGVDGTFGRPHVPNVDALIREYSKGDAVMISRFEEQVRVDMTAVQTYTWERIGDFPGAEQDTTTAIYQAARLLNFRYVKLHQLTAADVDILLGPFLFVTEDVIEKLVEENDEYNIVASTVDTGYDLWEFWHDSRTRLSHWYEVAKDVALIQPSSAFMERVFSILRACMDARQEASFSDRIGASALLKYNRGRGK